MTPSLKAVSGSYTSNDAAEISGVPFFTVDYWDRTRFLQPSLAKGKGRGRGRQRLYSLTDILRLRIARDLRDQHVSLQTLRHVVTMLASRAGELTTAQYVLVDREVRLAGSFSELITLLRGQAVTFGFFLDLTRALEEVARRADAVISRADSAPTVESPAADAKPGRAVSRSTDRPARKSRRSA